MLVVTADGDLEISSPCTAVPGFGGTKNFCTASINVPNISVVSITNIKVVETTKS